MDYLHTVGVVHGDLKGANVLLKSTATDPRGFMCKLADFGLSRVLDLDMTHISTHTYGTISYMPPELLSQGKMTRACDVYSFGMLSESPADHSVPYLTVYLSAGNLSTWRPTAASTLPILLQASSLAVLALSAWLAFAFHLQVVDRLSTACQGLQRLYMLHCWGCCHSVCSCFPTQGAQCDVTVMLQAKPAFLMSGHACGMHCT